MSVSNIQRVVLATSVAAALTLLGCSEKAAPAKANAPASSAALNDPRAKVLGVEHVGTAKETVGTSSPAKSDITKAQQDAAMPLPGQTNDHSTLSPKATQKATAPTSIGAPVKP